DASEVRLVLQPLLERLVELLHALGQPRDATFRLLVEHDGEVPSATHDLGRERYVVLRHLLEIALERAYREIVAGLLELTRPLGREHAQRGIQKPQVEGLPGWRTHAPLVAHKPRLAVRGRATGRPLRRIAPAPHEHARRKAVAQRALRRAPQ